MLLAYTVLSRQNERLEHLIKGQELTQPLSFDLGQAYAFSRRMTRGSWFNLERYGDHKCDFHEQNPWVALIIWHWLAAGTGATWSGPWQ